MKTFNFSANGIDFGNYEAASQEEAQEIFAKDANYPSWAAMVQQAEEFGRVGRSPTGNAVEVKEV